ncbi:MAG TPA: Dabb family protein [Eudoraea sp.]|nr:Dabb family protein [Eudoraea sp.]
MKNTLIIFTFLILSTTAHSQETKPMNNFDPAFVHTVFFWLNNPDNAADRASFEASLSKFLQNSQFAKTKFIGTPPKASRDVVDGSFTYSLVVTFDSAEAQQDYQEEPPHKLFIEESSNLWNKVIVYDSVGIVN